MLSEARVIAGGSSSQGKIEAGMRQGNSLREEEEKDPAGKRKGKYKSQDPGNGRPDGGGDSKSLLSGKESETGGQTVEIFPKDPGK